MAKRNYHSTRRRRRSPLARLLTTLVILGILFVGISVFFRVQEFEVIGETRYSSQEIIDASGIDHRSHLFLLSPASASSALRENLPFIETAQITRRFPNRVEIRVAETVAIAFLQVGAEVILLDRQCKVLELASHVPIGSIRVLGVEISEPPQAGRILILGEEQRHTLYYLQDILNLLFSLGLYENIVSLDMGELLNPILNYEDRLEIHLGPNRNLANKMNLLVGILEYLEADAVGIIDLINPERPAFRPAGI